MRHPVHLWREERGYLFRMALVCALAMVIAKILFSTLLTIIVWGATNDLHAFLPFIGLEWSVLVFAFQVPCAFAVWFVVCLFVRSPGLRRDTICAAAYIVSVTLPPVIGGLMSGRDYEAMSMTFSVSCTVGALIAFVLFAFHIIRSRRTLTA